MQTETLEHHRIAALFVEEGGAYFGLPHVDPWPESRDARVSRTAFANSSNCKATPHTMNTRTNHGAIVPIERIELPPFTLPTPPPGMKWHREDGWNDGDLPQGTRPFIEGEMPQKDDFCILDGRLKWTVAVNWWSDAPASPQCRYRTTRPLLFTHEGHEWTWHRAGDPCPCAEKRIVQVLLNDGSTNLDPAMPEFWDWEGESPDEVKIIGWRYADAEKPDEIPWIEWHGGPCPLKDEEVEEWERQYRNGTTGNGVKPSAFDWLNRGWNNDIIAYRVLKWREKKPKVPLGPEDVPPGSVFCVKDRMPGTWHGVLGVYASTVQLDTNRNTYSFYELQQEEWLINRSIPMTGKWDANAWEACEK